MMKLTEEHYFSDCIWMEWEGLEAKTPAGVCLKNLNVKGATEKLKQMGKTKNHWGEKNHPDFIME